MLIRDDRVYGTRNWYHLVSVSVDKSSSYRTVVITIVMLTVMLPPDKLDLVLNDRTVRGTVINRDSEYHSAGQPNIKNCLHHELSYNETLFLMPSRQRLRYLRLEVSCLPRRCHYVHSAHPPHHHDIQWRLVITIQIQTVSPYG